MRETIPEDLKNLYDSIKQGRNCTIIPTQLIERISKAEARNKVLEEALKASERIRSFDYMPWSLAGGPNECKHGVYEGIPCRKCDFETVNAALREDR